MNYRDAAPSSEGPKLPVDGGAKRRAFEVLGALAVVSAIAGGVVYFWSRPKPRPPVDYGVAAPLVKALEDELALRPCVIDNTLKLVELYLGHSNFHDARDRIATFREKCEEYRPLRRRSIAAYRGLNDYPSALWSR